MCRDTGARGGMLIEVKGFECKKLFHISPRFTVDSPDKERYAGRLETKVK